MNLLPILFETITAMDELCERTASMSISNLPTINSSIPSPFFSLKVFAQLEKVTSGRSLSSSSNYVLPSQC